MKYSTTLKKGLQQAWQLFRRTIIFLGVGRKEPGVVQENFQFIVIGQTGLQICKNFPIFKSVTQDQEKLRILKWAQEEADFFTHHPVVHLLEKYLAVSSVREGGKHSGWIPCDSQELVFFRVILTAQDLLLDLLIDTHTEAALQLHNQIPCVLHKKKLFSSSYFSLASFYIEKHERVKNVTGDLLVDYGNSASTFLFAPEDSLLEECELLALNQPFDPDYQLRTSEQKQIVRANLAALRVTETDSYENDSSWMVGGEYARELVENQPFVTYVHAPKKYVYAWPEQSSYQPTTQFRGIVGQRTGLHPLTHFVRLHLKNILMNALSAYLNPGYNLANPKRYPELKKVLFTYPLTWQQADRAWFLKTASEVVKEIFPNSPPVFLVCSEPVAVAAYLIQKTISHYGRENLLLAQSVLGNVSMNDDLRLLVVDIGGGSTDITLLETNWQEDQISSLDVYFQILESRGFPRGGDRISHFLVTAIWNYLTQKYSLPENSLDFEQEPKTATFIYQRKRTLLAQLTQKAEEAKIALSETDYWQLDEENIILSLKEAFPAHKIISRSTDSPFTLNNQILEAWLSEDTQEIEPRGGAKFLDTFLYLRDLYESSARVGKQPHLVVLSGRTSRLPFIKKFALRYLPLPWHRVRTLKELLPFASWEPNEYENMDKVAVVKGAHCFGQTDRIRFFHKENLEESFSQYLGVMKNTFSGQKIHPQQVFIRPGDPKPQEFKLQIPAQSTISLGTSFEIEGPAFQIAQLTNEKSQEETVTLRVGGSYSLELLSSKGLISLSQAAFESTISDNFQDSGKIDLSPPAFLASIVDN